jgi:hypothetical protein
MSTKKTRLTRKNVVISVDGDTWHKLRDAMESLSDFAGAYETAVDDPARSRDLLKG